MLNDRLLRVPFQFFLVLGLVLAATACQSIPFASGPGIQSPPAGAPPANEPLDGQTTARAPGTVQVLGTFTAPNQATLTFKISGRIIDLPAQEGATVKKGDTLAVLDTTELILSVQQAQAAVAGAQARLEQAKAPASVAAAQAALAAAQRNYDKLSAGPTTSDLAAAQAALAAAQQGYDLVRAGPTRDQVAQLKAQVDNARAALDQAQSAYDRAGGATNPYIGMLPQALQLQTASNNYAAVLGAYNNALNHPTAAELAAAQAQVQQAQAALNRLTPDAAQLAAAQAQVQQAQATLSQLQPGSDNVAAAQAAVDQAQAALALARQQVANATLIAPFDGTILTRAPHVGEAVGPTSPIVVLADLVHLQLQANVDQILLSQLRVGQPVSIVPDAFKDKIVSGKIARVGWVATSVGSVVGVPVIIDVDPSGIPLRPGLSASAQIQIQNPQ